MELLEAARPSGPVVGLFEIELLWGLKVKLGHYGSGSTAATM
jgi:hypothetical protein